MSEGTSKTNCEYCGKVSTSNQVCTQCGEPLVDNPEVSQQDWYEYWDGHPHEDSFE